jgi:putative transcriptional regulator
MRTADMTDLSGKLLIAMPGMGDPRFERAVILICAHSREGAMGLIVNKPMPDLVFADLLRQLEVPGGDAPRAEITVHFGGPVEHGRGFVLHTADYGATASTLEVGGAFGMTATLDILGHIAQGQGPKRAIMALGYSGWGPGQLEGEILRNGWLTSDASLDVVFSEDNGGKWGRALKQLGIDPQTLSTDSGRA